MLYDTQVIIFKQNFNFIYLFHLSHETIVLGGTRQVDDENTRVDLNDKDGIWQRCLRLCPSLAVSLILFV